MHSIVPQSGPTEHSIFTFGNDIVVPLCVCMFAPLKSLDLSLKSSSYTMLAFVWFDAAAALMILVTKKSTMYPAKRRILENILRELKFPIPIVRYWLNYIYYIVIRFSVYIIFDMCFPMVRAFFSIVAIPFLKFWISILLLTLLYVIHVAKHTHTSMRFVCVFGVCKQF